MCSGRDTPDPFRTSPVPKFLGRGVDVLAMGAALRVLLCAEEEWSHAADCFQGTGIELKAWASTGGDALAQHRRGENDAVIIVGDLDGCHGLRIAKVLNGARRVPTFIICADGHVADAQRAAAERGGHDVHILPLSLFRPALMADRVRKVLASPQTQGRAEPGAPGETTEPAHIGVGDIGRGHFDTVVLLGSAGTPNLLPHLLTRSHRRQAALVIAVHHNPRWSDAFSGWVAQLTGTPVLPWTSGALSPRTVYVVRSEGEGDILRPNLGEVVRTLVGEDRRILAMMASGMGSGDVGSLTTLKRAGGVLVALRPALCPQPAMVQSVIDADLVDAQVSIDELSWLIAHARSVRRLRPVGDGDKSPGRLGTSRVS